MIRRIFLATVVLTLVSATLLSSRTFASHAPGLAHRVYLPIVYAPPAPQPPPPANPTVHLLSSRSYVSGSSRYVVGEVINETADTVHFVHIDARFYDAANNLVAVEDVYTMLTETRPGQRNPFKLLLSNPPAGITHYELTLNWSVSSLLDYRPVTVVSQQTRNNFGVEVYGEVRNDQPQQLQGVEVAVTFYDAAGNVVETDFTFASTTTLPPGATSTYQVTTFRDFPFASYVVHAEGYVAP